MLKTLEENSEFTAESADCWKKSNESRLHISSARFRYSVKYGVYYTVIWWDSHTPAYPHVVGFHRTFPATVSEDGEKEEETVPSGYFKLIIDAVCGASLFSTQTCFVLPHCCLPGGSRNCRKQWTGWSSSQRQTYAGNIPVEFLSGIRRTSPLHLEQPLSQQRYSTQGTLIKWAERVGIQFAVWDTFNGCSHG